MSRSASQAKWRSGTRKQRVEVYLSPEIVEALDAMPGTRAEVIAALVEGAKQPPEHDQSATTGSNSSQEPVEQTTTGRLPYTFRRPKPTESTLAWLMIVDGEPWAELERYKPGLTTMWRARTLKRSLTWRWCKARTRGEVAERLYGMPDIWQ